MEKLLALARDVAYKAGDAVLTHYGTDTYELKDDLSPITLADQAAHNIIFNLLSQTHIPILSEEGDTVTLPYPDRLWIVDPLDGTKGFLKKTDDFSIMIGLVEYGRPVLGVVYAPMHRRMYTALRGEGTTIETTEGVTKARVSDRMTPHLRGIVSVNHITPYMHTVCQSLKVTETIAIGSVGIKAGCIASDQADFYTNRGNLGEWDVCAPEIILTEAGGIVTDTEGALLTYGTDNNRIERGVVFSNGACHERVIEALTQAP